MIGEGSDATGLGGFKIDAISTELGEIREERIGIVATDVDILDHSIFADDDRQTRGLFIVGILQDRARSPDSPRR